MVVRWLTDPRGAKPAIIAVEQPSNLKLMINLKTVKTLGLTAPPDLLAFAATA